MTSTAPSESADADSRWGRRWRLVRKELRETLRDRRTILTLLLMPILAYPLLGVAFQRLLIAQLSAAKPQYHIAAPTVEQADLFEQMYAQGRTIYDSREVYRREGTDQPEASSGEDVPPLSPAPNSSDVEPTLTLHRAPPGQPAYDVERMVASGEVDLGVIIERPGEFTRSRLLSSSELRLVYMQRSASSMAAYHFILDRLEALNASYLNDLARELKVPRAVADVRVTALPPTHGSGALLASLVPLVLLLMTVTGAVYPAIDLTAGERERHTLETLIAAPVSRLSVLAAKYVAVVTVAILTAGVNISAMLLTMQAVGLEQAIFGDAGLTIGSILALLGLLSVFAAFFSAVLLCLTSIARSFKEAQAYLIPLMLLSLAPGVVSLVPGIELGTGLALVPLLNMVLLARATVLGTATVGLTVVVVGSTFAYGAGALALASRVFGSDAVLAGSSGGWTDLFRRPSHATRITPDVAAAAFAVIFPVYFILGSGIGRFEGLSMSSRLMLNGAVTAALFAGWPWLVAEWRRAAAIESFRAWEPPALAIVGAAIAGCLTWPLAHEIAVLQQHLGITTIGQEQMERAKGILESFKTVPLSVVLVAIAVIPPVCEELCFRGFLFGALRQRMGGWATVLLTALAFGSFHLLVAGTLAIERFLPSTILGIVLGAMALWSGSVWPGMVFHVLHNGLVILLTRFPEQIKPWGLDVEEQQHFPAMWLAAAGTALVVGMTLIFLSRSRTADSQQQQTPALSTP